MKTSSGRYYNGRDARGYDVKLHVKDGHLNIETEAETLGKWPLGSIFRDEAQSVAVVIGCGSGPERVELMDHEILDELPIQKSTWSLKHLQSRKALIAFWIVTCVLVIVFGVLKLGIVAHLIAQRISPDTERSISEKFISNLGFRECTLTTSQSEALTKILQRLDVQTPERRERIQVKIAPNEIENAIAIPGGRIYVFNGLIKTMKSPEEFAGILAHEIEHVERRHVLESLINTGILTALFNLLAGDVSSIVILDPSTASGLLNLRLSRSMESEADAGALARLRKGKISAKGMVDFFERDDANSGRSMKSISYLSSHPLSSDRLKIFKAEKEFQTEPELLTAGEWADFKTVCQLGSVF